MNMLDNGGVGGAGDSTSRELIERWRGGDERAADELYRRYGEQLLRLVGNHLSARHGAQFDAEDVLQTTFRTLFRRTKRGEFQFDQDSDVYKLLVTIALNKLRRRVRALDTQKRNIRSEVPVNESMAVGFANGPTLQEAAEFAELLENITSFLTEDQRTLLRLRLEGYDQNEIAEKLGVTDRTVRRQWERIRQTVASLLDPADP
jgi:RNA polymerase sigma factor (sigma-70 family)